MQQQLAQEYGRDATVEEIAGELQLRVERVEAVLKMAQRPISLDAPAGDSEQDDFGDFLADERAENPSDPAMDAALSDKIRLALQTLSEKERMVLEQRFGLLDGEVRTLDEIGHHFHVTRERIRQIEVQALRKMRHPARSRELAGFFGAFASTMR